MRTAAGIGAVDAAVSRTAALAAAWRAVEDGQRAALLRATMRSVVAAADDWCRVSAATKAAPDDPRVIAEERVTGVVAVLRHLRQYAEALDAGDGFQATLPVQQTEGGAAVRVFPRERWDSVLFPGLRADVMLAPGDTPRRVARGPGGLAAILGAGNVTSIPVLDALWQMLVEDRVAVVKLHPVASPLLPVMERAFAPLTGSGYLTFVNGGAEEGSALALHPRVAAVHLTGSEASARALVAAGLPDDRPFTAELGAVTPVLVVPGPWSTADLRRQARMVAGAMAINGGYTCLTPKLLVTARTWRQRGAFLQLLRKELEGVPARASWYPGGERARADFLRATGAGAPLHGPERLPWLLAEGVPADRAHPALAYEHFGGLLAECALDVPAEPEAFLARAVRFVNDEVYGTLSCNLLAPPWTPRAALDAAVDGLRYGTVAVNTWAALGFLFGSTPWQAFPGADRHDPQSGFGTVHDALLLADPVKAVLRSPFRPALEPLWSTRRRRLAPLAEALQAFEAAPGLARLLPLAAAALRR